MRINKVNLSLCQNCCNKIRFRLHLYIVKSIVRSCIRVATIGPKSNHIISTIIVVAINDNIVVVIKVENNLSANNCIVFNRGIRRVITHFIYNRKSNDALI